MAGLNYFIKVDKEDDKRLYRIMKDLEYYGESFVDDASGPDWNGTMRKFGVRAKPLIEKDLLEPIWTPYKSDRTERKERLIRKKKSVVVTEIPKGNLSLFYFKHDDINIEMPKKRRRLI